MHADPLMHAERQEHQQAVREAELAPLMGRADWSPSLGHARFMPLEDDQ